MSEKVLFPVVKADEEEEAEEELVDPQKQLREVCSAKPDAQVQWAKYQECNDRVNSRSNTAETCEEELVDYLHVLDKCVAKDLFKRLKKFALPNQMLRSSEPSTRNAMTASINSRSNTAETCEEELVDFLHVLDKCVAKDLFKR